MELEPIFVTAIVFGFTYAIFDLFIKRKERMAIIERGIDPTNLKARPRPGVFALKLGLMFIGIAIGLFLGSVLVETTTIHDESAYFSMVFLFGGIGLVISHFLEKKEIREMKEL